jgi:hypothetical protein
VALTQHTLSPGTDRAGGALKLSIVKMLYPIGLTHGVLQVTEEARTLPYTLSASLVLSCALKTLEQAAQHAAEALCTVFVPREPMAGPGLAISRHAVDGRAVFR